MQSKQIPRANEAPAPLRRAAKVAFAVGAEVRVGMDGESLLVQFENSDAYYFDPEHTTLHMLEALGAARTYGFATQGFSRLALVVRTVFSNEDVRVQIGASKWFVSKLPNTARALRAAIVDAFCGYYDEAIHPAQT